MMCVVINMNSSWDVWAVVCHDCEKLIRGERDDDGYGVEDDVFRDSRSGVVRYMIVR